MKPETAKEERLSNMAIKASVQEAAGKIREASRKGAGGPDPKLSNGSCLVSHM
jgi:hypothetical protein